MLKGLATLQIMKTGIGVLFLLCFLSSAIYGVVSSMRKNYQKVSGNITTDTTANNQTVTYIVADKEYNQNVPFTTKIINNVTTTTPTHVAGPCTIYYAQANPNDYSVNINPVFMTQVISGVLCLLSMVSIGGLVFLRSNREVAGVLGGVDIFNNLFNRE